MGNRNTSSTAKSKFLEAKTKLEDYDNIPDLYQIINSKGGGQLVDLAWTAYKMRDLSIIDAYIRNEVVKYLLNGGKGEQVKTHKSISQTYILNRRINFRVLDSNK